MNTNILSTRRLALLSAGVSLFGAATAFGVGGSITISSAPALSLGSSGLTQGLVGTVWHVPMVNVSSGQYGIPAPTNTPPVYTNVTHVESYINSGSYTGATSGAAYTLPAAAETFLNTADTFNYNGGFAPTTAFLGADASGAAKYDGNQWGSSIVDQMGYIKIASAGSYTFTMKNADDAAEVFVGGTGITPSGNAGTGTPVVALGYDSNFNPVPTGAIPSTYGTANVSFSSAGYYPIEIMNYQQGGGANLNFSVTGAGGAHATYYTTTAMANSVTASPPTPTVATPPAATDEWNFGKSSISGSSVSDIGTAGSAATAGTIVGTGNTVSGGALITSNTGSGNGMSVPGTTFTGYTGSFSIAVTFNRSANDPTNSWGSVLGFGTKGNSGNNYIIMQPQRQDGTNWASTSVRSGGPMDVELIASNQKPIPASTLTQEVLVYNASTSTASLYINGVLQMSGQVLLPSGTTSLSLAALAGGTGNLDGIGGLDPYNDPTTLASYYDLSTWNSALTANQVDGLFSGSAVPEPGAVALLGIGAMGLLLISRRRKANA